MDRKKSQAVNFAFEVVPIMFHSQTSEFIKYMKRDGCDFLKFWWNYIGEQLPEEQHCSFEGMESKLVEINDRNTMIIITMPQPRDEGEALFILLMSKPEKRFAWVRLPSTRALVLIKKTRPDDINGTELGEITPRGIYVPMRRGPAPTIQSMTNIAMDLIKEHKS